jgi:restriction system protein
MKYIIDDIIDGETISLEEFLSIVLSKDYHKVFPNNCFPSNAMLDEYIDTIKQRKDNDVKKLINLFLVHEGRYGSDDQYRSILKCNPEMFKKLKEHRTQYLKRLIATPNVWEGITWILDLLPDDPRQAINVIDAFFNAYCLILPDNVLFGLSNINEIIRAKYINEDHSVDVLHNLSPYEFECLVAKIFDEMEYDVKLTKKSHDGGIDIIAEKKQKANKEIIYIQCKRYIENVGVKDLRELLGVVENFKATKGIFCTCSNFTKSAKKFCENSNRLEILNGQEIIRLCNEYFGSKWPNKVGVYLYEYYDSKI